MAVKLDISAKNIENIRKEALQKFKEQGGVIEDIPEEEDAEKAEVDDDNTKTEKSKDD